MHRKSKNKMRMAKKGRDSTGRLTRPPDRSAMPAGPLLMKCRMDRMDILFPCYGALTAAANPVRFFQAPILINWTSRRVVLGALFTRSVAPTPILGAPNLFPESWRNAKSACTCGSTRYLARTALPVVIIFSREQENGPPAEHGEIRGLGGGIGGLRATQKASPGPPADPRRLAAVERGVPE